MTVDRDRRGRGVPIVYALVTSALLFGVLALALSSPPPRTPPLAAVAPQVDEQVEVERVEQSSQFGEGAGGEGDCAPGDVGCAGTGAETTTVREVAIPAATSAPADFWPCVLGPGGARQTEDPQSPPCKAERFTGDNGGATSRGVTATEIRLAIIGGRGQATDKQRYNLTPLVAHVNRRYELYGRRLVLVEVEANGDVTDPSAQRADAEQIASADVFAAFAYPAFGEFQRTLAQRGVITLADGAQMGLVPEAALGRLHPYVWSVYPSLEESLGASGDLICDSLVGRPARHGGPEVASETRRFGVITEAPSDHGTAYDASVLLSRLRGCGEDAVAVTYSAGSTDRALLMRRLRDDGVTTVVCVCRKFESSYTEAAEALGWQPEWFLPGIDDSMLHLRYRAYSGDEHPRAQIAHAFGLTGRLRRPVVDPTQGRDRRDEQYWFHAARAEDPGFTCPVGPCDHTSTLSYGLYAQLLTLASGIQWAGPDLTPETFGDALTGLRYPNPGVGESPWWQPSAGFGPADHGFNSDFALFWWRDPDEAGYQARTDFGEMCYVGNGRRYTPDALPPGADDRFFDPTKGCR